MRRGSGDVHRILPIRTTVWTGSGDEFNCRVTACSIVLTQHSPLRQVEAVLQFDPDVLPLRSSLELSPASDLHGGEVVTVRGSGFRSYSHLRATQCPAGATDDFECDFRSLVRVWTGPPGRGEPSTAEANVLEGATFEAQFKVRACMLSTEGRAIDCRAEACELVVEQVAVNPEFARIALDFDADRSPGPVSARPTLTG